jgi:hypothetical protein
LRLFDKKIADTTVRGFNVHEATVWMQGVKKIDDFKYYHFAPGANRPTESQHLKDQPVTELLDFLNADFVESVDSFVEVQRKVFMSGREQVIVRKIAVTASARDISKIAVLEYKKSS